MCVKHSIKTVLCYNLPYGINSNTVFVLHCKNCTTRTFTKDTDRCLNVDLMGELYHEMVQSIPLEYNNTFKETERFTYFSTFCRSKPFPCHKRQISGEISSEEVVLDENERSKCVLDHRNSAEDKYYHLGGLEISSDNRFVAVAEDFTGSERYEIRIKSLDGEGFLNEVLERTSPHLAWGKTDTAQYIYYVKLDEKDRAYKILRHAVGTPLEEDETVFLEHDPSFHVSVWLSNSEEFIYILSESATTSEIHGIPHNSKRGKPFHIVSRKDSVGARISDNTANFFLHIRETDTPNGRIVSTPIPESFLDDTFDSDTTFNVVQRSKELVPHNNEEIIVDTYQLEDSLAIIKRKEDTFSLDCITLEVEDENIKFMNSNKWNLSRFELDQLKEGSLNFEPSKYHSKELRVGSSHWTAPYTVHSINLENGNTRKLERCDEMNRDYSLYNSKRVVFLGYDGTVVPMTMIFRKDKGFSSDQGGSPTVLYTYGCYGTSSHPRFLPEIFPLLDRGVMYCIAHVRGGGELGLEWQNEGRHLKKMNSILDFVAASEYLINEKLCSPSKLAVEASSAGGVIVAAAINLRPELYQMALMQSPFLNVLSSMLDANMPLVSAEYEEWGDPGSCVDDFLYISRYSPVQNVRYGIKYPAFLLECNINDSRVHYWNSIEYAQTIRNVCGNNTFGPVLVRVNNTGGHFSRTGSSLDSLKSAAERYSFLLSAFNSNKSA